MSRLFGGLRAQVASSVLVVTACFYSVLGVIGFRAVAHAGHNAVVSRVNAMVSQLASQLSAAHHVVQITTPDGVVAWVVSPTIPALGPLPHEVEITHHVTVHGVHYAVEGAASDISTTANLHALYLTLWIGVPLAAILSALLAGYAVHRALRHVGDITDHVRNIGPSDIDTRVPRTDSGDEIDELARTVNLMLERIAAGRLAQRQFTSDAAHELRTPLMVIQGEMELMARSSSVDPEVLSRTQSAVTHLSRLVDDLLLLSTLEEGRPLRISDVDVAELVREETLVVSQSVTVTTSGDTHVAGDATLIARAVRNLLANAQRYATSKVEVRIDGDTHDVWIFVEDDGPGFPSTEDNTAFDRFRQFDESRSTSGGAGLGLAITASIASAHQGDVQLSSSSSGGASVAIRLPRRTAE